MAKQKRTVGEIIMEWTKSFGLILDYLKVTRRTVLVVYGYFLYETSHWFFALPDPSTQQVTYVTAILGLAGIIFGFYSNSPADYVKLDNAHQRLEDDRDRYSRGSGRPTSRYNKPMGNRHIDQNADFPDASDEEGFWDDAEN